MGQPVIYDDHGNTSIGGLVNGQTYYVIATSDPDQVMLASSLDNAELGTAIHLETPGTGTQSLDVTVSESLHNGTGIYTAADQQAVLQGLEQIYAPFNNLTLGGSTYNLIQFTLDPSTIPTGTPYETVYFNATPMKMANRRPAANPTRSTSAT